MKESILARVICARLEPGASGQYGGNLGRFARDGDIGGTKEIFVKSEQLGEIIVDRADIGRADLVDLTPGACRELATDLPFTIGEGQTSISVDAEMTRYWLRLRV